MEKNMQEIMQKAEVLIEALPYIRDFNNKKVGIYHSFVMPTFLLVLYYTLIILI